MTYDFEAKHGSMEAAVPEQPDTACISRNVAPYLAAAGPMGDKD